MASPNIASGNVGGLLAFMDFMIDKGYASAGAINPWKSAAKQVFSTVEGEDFEGFDVRSFDTEEYMSRFENRSLGSYSAESLRAYRQRFKKAVDSYRSYLADPNWRPPAGRVRAKKADGPAPSRPKRGVSAKTEEATPSPASLPASPALIAYPFPLKNGQMASLHLPAQGLDRDDAERLTHFLRALVFEQPAQLGPGQPGGED